ncbi:hypothetical protein Ddye_022711 [Dipteronia dyeriana]|uniref:Uncharacterized protein n=1 Tax=Dipteronia dyeriana TaxID=168575 RepID=A0AAD9TS53_9ROSI|nr:hypothetical protein Ddye_022711 [Dipteronia dyeriana]
MKASHSSSFQDEGFLDGTSLCPVEKTLNSNGNQVTNHQDQLIASWIAPVAFDPLADDCSSGFGFSFCISGVAVMCWSCHVLSRAALLFARALLPFVTVLSDLLVFSFCVGVVASVVSRSLALLFLLPFLAS